uniref:Uncharacterized protein n=1 Tax=Anguilla anguilla TaxID=7936 RepID=A0A0E9XYH5_ANGAN
MACCDAHSRSIWQDTLYSCHYSLHNKNLIIIICINTVIMAGVVACKAVGYIDSYW